MQRMHKTQHYRVYVHLAYNLHQKDLDSLTEHHTHTKQSLVKPRYTGLLTHMAAQGQRYTKQGDVSPPTFEECLSGQDQIFNDSITLSDSFLLKTYHAREGSFSCFKHI